MGRFCEPVFSIIPSNYSLHKARSDQWSSSTQYKYLSVVRGIQHSLWAKIVFSACAVQTLARFQATPPKGWSLTMRRSAIRPLQNREFCYPHVFKAASRPLVC